MQQQVLRRDMDSFANDQRQKKTNDGKHLQSLSQSGSFSSIHGPGRCSIFLLEKAACFLQDFLLNHLQLVLVTNFVTLLIADIKNGDQFVSIGGNTGVIDVQSKFMQFARNSIQQAYFLELVVRGLTLALPYYLGLSPR